MAQFMTQAGLAVATVRGQIMGKGFNTTSPGQLSWFAAAYSLTAGTYTRRGPFRRYLWAPLVIHRWILVVRDLVVASWIQRLVELRLL